MTKNSNKSLNFYLDNLIQKLELTSANLASKLKQLHQLDASCDLNQDIAEILLAISTHFSDDFYNLTKIVSDRFLQTANCTDADAKQQINLWFSKDFINADKLYAREFLHTLDANIYLTHKNIFLQKLILEQNFLATSLLKSYKSQLLDTSTHAAISEFSQSFSIINSEIGKDILQLKFYLLLNHSQISSEQILYFCLLGNKFTPKRHSTFVDFIANSVKTSLCDRNFFARFQQEMQEFCNLPSMFYTQKSCVFSLNGDFCSNILEKLVADFLFVNAINFKFLPSFSKPLDLPSFYLPYEAIAIFIYSDFKLKIVKKNLPSIELEFAPTCNKSQAYQLLEEHLFEPTRILQPLSPELLWQKTANFFETIFVHQIVQILEFLWHKKISLTQLQTRIHKNSKFINASNCVIYLLKNIYSLLLVEFKQDFYPTDSINSLAQIIDLKTTKSFILIDNLENLHKDEEVFLRKLAKQNRVFLTSDTKIDFAVSNHKNVNSTPNRFEILPANFYIEFYSLAMLLPENTACDLSLMQDFLLTGLLDILRKNCSTKTQVICLATKMQADLLQTKLSKMLDLTRVEFFYTGLNVDFFSPAQAVDKHFIILDMFFADDFLVLNDEFLARTFLDLNSQLLSAIRVWYKKLLTIDATKTLVFDAKTSSNFANFAF